MAKLNLSKLTPEQIAALQSMGFEMQWTWKCPFCRKATKTASSEVECDKMAENHLNRCKPIRFWKHMSQLLPTGECQGGELAYILTGKFPKGYRPQPKNRAMLRTLRHIVEAKDNLDSTDREKGKGHARRKR